LNALESGLGERGAEDGGFPQVSGIRLRYDPARPEGSKIISAEIAGVHIRKRASYRLAVTDFTAKGGYGYAALAKAKVLTPPDERVELQDIAAHYLRWRGKAEASDMPRITRQ
jgi:2',3'-cyclic-nucleotide 2'-phosphodiesterase (5'-nucleotidase family)